MSNTAQSSQGVDRPPLVEKARAFLLSPAVRHENEAAKRRFLQEKGLTGEEIDVLIRELPPQPPPVPPRTYPQPPPSPLPVLLGSFFRLFMWTAGMSGVLLLGYYRFLLPRLTRSLGARHKLKRHQSELLGHLEGRIQDLKVTQEEVYNVYPGPDDEPIPKDIKGLTDLAVNSTGVPIHSFKVVVRCAFLGVPEQKLTLDELYTRLLIQFPALKRVDATEYKHLILRELSHSKSFDKATDGNTEYWSLRQDINSDSVLATGSTHITKSLQDLRDAVSRRQMSRNAYQHTFKSLTDLTALLSRETFALHHHGATTGFRYGLQGGHPLTPAEEDVKKEIRALKGLVLNRRSFTPNTYRPSSATVGSTS